MDCVICGKEFSPRNSKHKTCSKACSKKLHDLNVRKYQEKNKEFFKNYGKQYRLEHQEYFKAYQKNYERTHKKVLKEKGKKYRRIHRKEISEKRKKKYKANKQKNFCVICGKDITHLHGSRKTCKKCFKIREKKRNEKYRKKHYKNKICIVCGKKISNHVNRSKYCVECSKIGKIKLTKLLVLRHYGGNPPKCAKCNEKNIKFLCLDHINNDGNIQRKKLSKLGTVFYRWLIKNNFPKGLQVLCYNCNRIKSSQKISKIRKKVLEHYSGSPPKCSCCGEKRIKCLVMDHIHGRNGKKRQHHLTKFLFKKNFPKGFQVLCANCNQAKRDSDNKFCPVHYPELYK